ncbi:MAG: S8 family serine peptidase [Chitinophagales bacterium]
MLQFANANDCYEICTANQEINFNWCPNPPLTPPKGRENKEWKNSFIASPKGRGNKESKTPFLTSPKERGNKEWKNSFLTSPKERGNKAWKNSFIAPPKGRGNKAWKNPSLWEGQGRVSGQLLLKLKEKKNLLQLKQVLPFKKYQIEAIQPAFPSLQKMDKTYRIHFKNTQLTQQLLTQIAALSYIEYVEQIPIYQTFYTPNDLHPSQWNLSKIQAQTAWDFVKGSANIVVAIVDDAVETTHPDLAVNIWQNVGEIPNNGVDDDDNGYVDDVQGYDVADDDNNPNPPFNADAHHFSHGTHCAGIVSAVTDNNKGIAAIGGNVRLMVVKSKENATSGSSLQAGMEGVAYSIAAGANVISMSWGGPAYSQTLQDLITVAHEQGIVLVAAAGNSDTDAPMYPASYDHVISVGATNQEDEKAFFSNYGDKIDVMAPGFEIWSTVAGKSYDFKNGTSMACPLVAGLAGLMLSYNEHISPDDLEECLKNSCDNIDGQNGSYLGQIGAGRINAFEALACLRVPPTAFFAANLETACAGEAVQFFDKSLGADIDTWTWTFENATPSFSNLKNPIVTFNGNGTFEIQLTVTNPLGSHTTTQNFTIQPPTATISGNSVIAEGDNTAFKITFTGSPPFYITYTDGETEQSIDNITENPFYVVFSPEITATYSLVSMSSAVCEGTVEGEAKVSVLPPPEYAEATGSGLPVWPFVSSQANTCEVWTWFPEENWELMDCPFNSTAVASGVGLTPCGEALFYVYHTGEDAPNQLFVTDVNAQPLHMEGMNALMDDKELQLVPVPKAFNEWYVVYSIYTDEILAGGRTAYTPTNIVYSRFFYDGNSFHFIEKDVVLEVNGQVQTYTHGKAISQRMGANEDFHYLYTCRRKWNSNTLSLDRFIIDNQNIRWDKSTYSTPEDFWNLTIAGSPIEISPKGDKMVVVSRNQSYTATDLFVFDLEPFDLSSMRKISLGKLTLMPDFENLFEPMKLDDVANTVEGLGFLKNISRKIFDAEFSPSGDFLYFSNGGFVSSNYTNITYLGQIDLTTPYPYQMRLQVQTTPDDSYDVETGRGCVYTSTCLSKYQPINNIELGYDGRLYFQKQTTNKLYVVPNANLPMQQRLIPGDVDLSTPESPNLPVSGAISAFPQSIDGYQYIPPNFAKFNIPVQIEDCHGCLNPENFPVTVELQTAEGELIKAAVISECPAAIEVCLDISRQYRLFFNGAYIENILKEGKLWEELPYTFQQGTDVDLVLEELPLICLGEEARVLQATPIGGNFSGTGVENGIFYPSIAGLGTHTIYYEYLDIDECVAVESMDIEVVGVEIEAGISPTICPNESVQLQASNAPNYLWTPSTDLNQTNIANPTANPAQTTTYRVETTDANGCTAMDEVTVYVAPLPVLQPIAVDTSVCKGTVLEMDLSKKITPISDYSYHWTPSTGVSNPDIANPTITLSESATYTLEVTNELGCVSEQEVMIEVEILEAILDLGENLQANCGENIVLNAPEGNVYKWFPTTNLSCNDCQNPTAILSETTTFHLTFEDFNGCVAEDSITVEVVGASLDLGENLQANCGENIVLNAPEGDVYKWFPTANLSCNDCQNPTAILSETTTFHLTFEDFNGCVAEDSITVEVVDDLEVVLEQYAFCEIENVVLEAGDFVEYEWSNGSTTSSIEVQNEGVYFVTLTNAAGCKLAKKFNVLEYEQPQVVIEGEAEILEGETTVLTAMPDFDLYEWSNSAVSQTIEATTMGIYTVMVTDTNGCTATAFFELNVLPNDTLPIDTLPTDSIPDLPTDTIPTDTIPDLPTDTIPDPPILEDLDNKLVVPTAFSPNGDGINDVFLIRGQNIVDVQYAIYNRWGQKVFEAGDLVAVWDGRFKGQDLDLGTYIVDVWVRFRDGNEEVKRGWVVLIR